MEEQKDFSGMIEIPTNPVFFVKDNTIVRVNQAAEGHFITVGTSIGDLLDTGKEEYAEFEGGCLYLTLLIGGNPCGASVIRMDAYDVFILEHDGDRAELRSMALAARELREPLANVMILADQLLPLSAVEEDAETREQVARLNRGLFQMLRVICNMSDAHSWPAARRQETMNICAVLQQIFDRAEVLVSHTGIKLTYEGLSEQIYCLANEDQLERAVLNILSNSIRFTPEGGSIEAKLSRRGRMLRLSVRDSGSGIADHILDSVFSRYLRKPAIEDNRFGVGLGMVLIRSAAASHGGTVLIDRPEGKGTRITMTISIRQNTDGLLRSDTLKVDYSGEQNHGLVELSGCLPVSLYEKENKT